MPPKVRSNDPESVVRGFPRSMINVVLFIAPGSSLISRFALDVMLSAG